MKKINKYLVLTAILLTFPFLSHSQDMIVKRNKDVLDVSILEIDSLIIKYRIFDLRNSPLFTINKSDVEKVVLESGSVIFFESGLGNVISDKETTLTPTAEATLIGAEEIPVVLSDKKNIQTVKVKKKRRPSGGGFGVKGGLNYNSNGNYFEDAQLIFGDPLANLGFHAGFFGKVKFGPFFLRPELMYSQLKTELNNETFLTQRVDAPALLGLGLLGQFLTVFAGPSFHYTLHDELSVTADQSNLNMGYQAGFGLNIGKLGIDLRYERVLSGTTIDFDQILTGTGDFKSQQLICGVSIKF
jgi:hypothetical protein